MIIFNIFAISSGLVLGWLLFDVLSFFKPKIYAVCLDLIEILEAKTNIRLRSKRNGFDLAQKEYNAIQIQNERARIKKLREPQQLEPTSCRTWIVKTNIQTLEYTTIETTNNELATLD